MRKMGACNGMSRSCIEHTGHCPRRRRHGFGRPARHAGVGQLQALGVLIGLLLAAAPALYGDVVHKVDGSCLKGEIEKEDEDSIWVKTSCGTIRVDKCDIDRIEPEDAGGEPGTQKQPAAAKPAAPEEVEKAGKPDAPRGSAAPGKPAGSARPAKASSGKDLLGDDNLGKLKKICEERAAAHEGVPWEKAHVISTAHFDLKCNCTIKAARYYAWVLEKLYDKYSRVFAGFDPGGGRCAVRIYRSHDEFCKLENKPANNAGYYSPSQQLLAASHGGAVMTIAHEGCHFFQYMIFGGAMMSMPIWLIEGMAVVMECARVDRKNGKILLEGCGYRLPSLQKMIRQGSNIPLSQVMGTPQAQFSGKHYAHAGVFTYWLIEGSGKSKFARLYHDFLRLASGGAGRPSHFEELCKKFGTTLSAVEEEWKKWVLEERMKTPGKVVGGRFVCEEHGFEVSAPGPEWKLSTENMPAGEFCVMTHESVNGYISIRTGGTGVPRLPEFIAAFDQARKTDELQSFRRISLEYRKYMKDALDGYDMVEEYADPNNPVTTALQRRRSVGIFMIDLRYIVSCSADPDKFDALQPYFNKTVESLRIDADKLD